MDRVVIRDILLNNLFLKAEHHVVNLMTDIITLNIKELNLSTTQRYFFSYGTEVYCSAIPQVSCYLTLELELQDHLLKRFKLLHDMENELVREKIVIKSYFTALLNHAELVSDIIQMLPSEYTNKNFEHIIIEPLSNTAQKYLAEIEASGKQHINETLLKKRTLGNLIIRNFK